MVQEWRDYRRMLWGVGTALELKYPTGTTMRSSFSTGQILEIAKISRRTLERWHALNLLVPVGGKSPGKGTNRQYSFGNLVVALVLSRLRARQFPLELSTSLVRYTHSLTVDHSVSEFVVLSEHGDFIPLAGSDVAAHFARDDSKVAVVLQLGSIHGDAVHAASEWTYEARPRRGPKPGQAAKKPPKHKEESKVLRDGTKATLSTSITQRRKNNPSNATRTTNVGQIPAAGVSIRRTRKAPKARGQTDSGGKYKARAANLGHGGSTRSDRARPKRVQRRSKSRGRRAHRRRRRSGTARTCPSTSAEPYPPERSLDERHQVLGSPWRAALGNIARLRLRRSAARKASKTRQRARRVEKARQTRALADDRAASRSSGHASGCPRGWQDAVPVGDKRIGEPNQSPTIAGSAR